MHTHTYRQTDRQTDKQADAVKSRRITTGIPQEQ